MILFITTRCNSNCTHCLSSCTSTGIDMTDEVLTTAIGFINQISPLAINISGGEPSLHADLLHIIKRLKHEVKPNPEFNIQPAISLITNGTFYASDEHLLQQLLGMGIFVQVPVPETDKIFYGWSSIIEDPVDPRRFFVTSNCGGTWSMPLPE